MREELIISIRRIRITGFAPRTGRRQRGIRGRGGGGGERKGDKTFDVSVQTLSIFEAEFLVAFLLTDTT